MRFQGRQSLQCHLVLVNNWCGCGCRFWFWLWCRHRHSHDDRVLPIIAYRRRELQGGRYRLTWLHWLGRAAAITTTVTCASQKRAIIRELAASFSQSAQLSPQKADSG